MVRQQTICQHEIGTLELVSAVQNFCRFDQYDGVQSTCCAAGDGSHDPLPSGCVSSSLTSPTAYDAYALIMQNMLHCTHLNPQPDHYRQLVRTRYQQPNAIQNMRDAAHCTTRTLLPRQRLSQAAVIPSNFSQKTWFGSKTAITIEILTVAT